MRTTGMVLMGTGIYKEEVSDEAESRNVELTEDEYVEVEDFLMVDEGLSEARLLGVIRALDMIVERRFARACGVDVDSEEVDDSADGTASSEGGGVF